MYSSNITAIQDLSLRRLGSLRHNTLKSLSACFWKERHLFFRVVFQTDVPNSRIEQFNAAMSDIARDMKHVFGEQLNVRLDIMTSPDPDDHQQLEIEIFNIEKDSPSLFL